MDFLTQRLARNSPFVLHFYRRDQLRTSDTRRLWHGGAIHFGEINEAQRIIHNYARVQGNTAMAALPAYCRSKSSPQVLYQLFLR